MGFNSVFKGLMCNHTVPRLKISGTFPSFHIIIVFSYSNVELSGKDVTLPRKVVKRSSIDAETYTKITESSAGPLKGAKNTGNPLSIEYRSAFCEGKVTGE